MRSSLSVGWSAVLQTCRGSIAKTLRQTCGPLGSHLVCAISGEDYFVLKPTTGQGARSCVGRPLAEIEMLLVTTTLARNFKFSLDKSTTEASMRCVLSEGSPEDATC